MGVFFYSCLPPLLVVLAMYQGHSVVRQLKWNGYFSPCACQCNLTLCILLFKGYFPPCSYQCNLPMCILLFKGYFSPCSCQYNLTVHTAVLGVIQGSKFWGVPWLDKN